LRSYQHAESGIIPQQPNREAIAKALGVTNPNALFIDPTLVEHSITREISPKEALEVLRRFIEDSKEMPPKAAQIISRGLTEGFLSSDEPAKHKAQLVKKKMK
jgi:hypothetical protein